MWTTLRFENDKEFDKWVVKNIGDLKNWPENTNAFIGDRELIIIDPDYEEPYCGVCGDKK